MSSSLLITDLSWVTCSGLLCSEQGIGLDDLQSGFSNFICFMWRLCFGSASAWSRLKSFLLLKMWPRKFSENRDQPVSSLQTAWMSGEMHVPCSTKLIAQDPRHCSLQLDAACTALRTRIRGKILFFFIAYLFLDRSVGNWAAGSCSFPPVVCLNLNTGHCGVQSTFCYGNEKIMVISKAIKPS